MERSKSYFANFDPTRIACQLAKLYNDIVLNKKLNEIEAKIDEVQKIIDELKSIEKVTLSEQIDEDE